MLVFAFMMTIIGFSNITIVVFVLAEGIVYFLWYCRRLLYLGLCLGNTDTADGHAHYKEQHYFFHR
jgi:hypothetical protein